MSGSQQATGGGVNMGFRTLRIAELAGQRRTLDRGTKTGHAYVFNVTNRAVEPRSGSLRPARARHVAPTNGTTAPFSRRQARLIDRRKRAEHAQAIQVGWSLQFSGIDAKQR
jgi:hypothetical protein